jgi:hypothetical protein
VHPLSQAPAEQTSPSAQRTLQPPQWEGAKRTSTQTSSQRVSVGAQSAAGDPEGSLAQAESRRANTKVMLLVLMAALARENEVERATYPRRASGSTNPEKMPRRVVERQERPSLRSLPDLPVLQRGESPSGLQ